MMLTINAISVHTLMYQSKHTHTYIHTQIVYTKTEYHLAVILFFNDDYTNSLIPSGYNNKNN